MNVCKVPDMCKDMEYKYITEDSKTRVYLSVVRKFNEAEYEKYYIRKKKAFSGTKKTDCRWSPCWQKQDMQSRLSEKKFPEAKTENQLSTNT